MQKKRRKLQNCKKIRQQHVKTVRLNEQFCQLLAFYGFWRRMYEYLGMSPHTMIWRNMMLNLSILLFCVAIALLGLGGFIFRVRALLNKRPWNGPVLPLSVIGVILFIVSLVMIYLSYPK